MPGASFHLETWLEQLELRHCGALRFQEVRKGVEALSRVYVEQRQRIGKGQALKGAGKRAAFAVFYSPLHFLLIQRIVRALMDDAKLEQVFDLGCGLGVAGAAWALELGAHASVVGYEMHPWAAGQAKENLALMGLRGRVHQRSLLDAPPAGGADAVVAAFAVNELDDQSRRTLLARLLADARRGALVLVVEPVARRPIPWWDGWAASFLAAGGRADEWRFSVALPSKLRKLDKASGLRHDTLTGRSLFLRA